jgi:hypothetical protein
MLWVIGFIILLVALMIPILAIVLDSPAVRKVLESRQGADAGRVAELSHKVAMLEDQVDDLTRVVDGMKEEQAFLHRLLENPERQAPSKRLPPAT